MSEPLLIRALKGEPVERPPVWAMRQAGRWDPEFRRVRAGRDFFEFSRDSEASAEASLCPKRFGVDGIILFYDIVTLADAMGLSFKLVPGRGPVPDKPVRSRADVERLDARPDPSKYGYILDLLHKVKKSLNGELPVLYFAGAPFTVASYCIGTGKRIDETRKFIAEEPVAWEGLLDKLRSATVEFLNVMAREGGQFYQLFDSWAGELTPEEYGRYALPHHRAIFAGAKSVPRAIFVKETPYTDELVQSGADVISIGRRQDLAELRRRYPDKVFQGNVDEELLRDGTPEAVAEATRSCLAEGGGTKHVVNLNHGCDKATPPENFAAFIKAAKGE